MLLFTIQFGPYYFLENYFEQSTKKEILLLIENNVIL